MSSSSPIRRVSIRHGATTFSSLQDGLKQRDGAGAEQIHSTVQAGIVQRAGKPRMAAGSAGTLECRCRRQAGRGVAAGADLRQPRPPHRQPRSAGTRETRAPARARARVFRAHRSRSRYRVSHRLASQRARAQAQAARNHRATRIRVLRHHRRRVRARVEHRRAPVAAGPVPGRAAARQAQRRRAEKHSLAALGGGRPRALPAHQVRRPEAFLARRRRLPRFRCWTTSSSVAASRASKSA